MSETPELRTVKPPLIPAKLMQQPGPGLDRVISKTPVGFTLAGVLVFPATTDALVQNDVHAGPLSRSVPTLHGLRCSLLD